MNAICLIPLLQKLKICNSVFLAVTVLFILYSSCSIKEGLQQKDNLQYDVLTKKYVYNFVEQMPSYRGGDDNFMAEFFKKFHYDFQKNEVIQTILQVQFVINKKGRLTGARILNKKTEELTGFEKAGLEAIESLQDWEAGKHNNKSVNVMLTKTIQIDFQ